MCWMQTNVKENSTPWIQIWCVNVYLTHVYWFIKKSWSISFKIFNNHMYGIG
jgi:hypothetical protein